VCDSMLSFLVTVGCLWLASLYRLDLTFSAGCYESIAHLNAGHDQEKHWVGLILFVNV
jgi:hypothetical protein